MERKKEVSIILLLLLLVVTITTQFMEHWRDAKSNNSPTAIQKEIKFSAKN
ncbi:hypothetical protein [Solitalea longa]|uniref:hypothetical protein n=1 Tax=Solitalea longa TaxID=2079460 RepID=UPI0013FE39E2|nr:hypothetical protein [Solitalea longa]